MTRETDYALRVLRALLDGEKRSVGAISKSQLIPQQFAYKITKKLEKAGLVEVTRGTEGGCRLAADLRQVSLYELMLAMGDRSEMFCCMDPAVSCVWRELHGSCQVNIQIHRIQSRLNEELRAHSLWKILTGEE